MSQGTEALLSVRGLTTEYVTRSGTVHAVRGISFDLAAGSKLAIVGESGSGKSALALSILGLIEPPGRIVSGEVWLGGQDLLRLDDRGLSRVRGRRIALIFQDPTAALDPVKTIGTQIVEAIRLHQPVGAKAARAQAVSLLQDVEVPNAAQRLDDYPHQYSGGMRQRVMIAIALANQPDLVIADEPTTALDVTTQAQVIDLLDRLATERGTAVILITHNLGIVAELCDSVNVMYAGRFVERAAVADIFTRARHPYTEALLRSVVRADRLVQGRLPAIGGAPPDLTALPPGCSFEPRCPVGHGRERCRLDRPEPVEVVTAGRTSTAECHFAQDPQAQLDEAMA